jgi:transcriptional regulator with GAF, ATPase, and Fis domain
MSGSSRTAPGNLDEGDLAAAFASVAQDLMSRRDLQHTVEGVVEAATTLITGCEYAGVMTMSGGRVESPAVSSELVVVCDKAQLDAGEGPCLTALHQHGPPIQVDDLSTEQRWPRFAKTAAQIGMRSMLSCTLDVGRPGGAALNLYSTRTRAFDADSVQIGRIFAMHASMAMARASLEEQLRQAVESRAGIGQAMGILMERHRVTSEQAFEMLRIASQNMNIRLRDLAEQVVRTGLDPALVTPAARGRTGKAESG